MTQEAHETHAAAYADNARTDMRLAARLLLGNDIRGFLHLHEQARRYSRWAANHRAALASA